MDQSLLYIPRALAEEIFARSLPTFLLDYLLVVPLIRPLFTTICINIFEKSRSLLTATNTVVAIRVNNCHSALSTPGDTFSLGSEAYGILGTALL